MANILFNDFHEPFWNFRLRIKIESSKIRLETTPDYRPQAPITVAPGIAKTFSGADWEDYFNYNNLVVSGVSVTDLISTGGKLPEGFYSFCFQVLDYDTGDPLSEEICRTAWIKLTDPPRINLPLCNTTIDPKLTQHAITWQMFDTGSPNATQGTDFQLTIWEITERTANDQTAVANGQALQIFQSDILHQSTYLYGLADPPFELGKKYVYRVQAIDPQGRDKFKNQGYSEFCSFYYGWPLNGDIDLKFPIEGGGFRKKDIPYVSWSKVDTQLPGQQVSYEINVVPINEGQTKEEAILSNSPWYYGNTPPSPTTYDRSQQIDQTLQVMTKYAWQVKAFTNQQEVGKSKVSYFNGPSLMENFWASVHRVAVDYIDGTDLNDISGEGRIRLKPEADAWTAVRFEHIKLQNMGDFYVMVGGEFYYEPQNLSIELTADIKRNGKAYFDVDRFRINKDGIYAEGLVRWPFPHATVSTALPLVKSNKLLANYNNFTINTAARIAPGNQFKLLEPFNFTINLSQSGIIYIYNNEYRFDLKGMVELPQVVKGPIPGIVQLPFRHATQLFYFEQDSIGTGNTIAPLAKSNVELVTNKYILDLSEEDSPDKFQSDLKWKGIYFQDFDLVLHTALDGNGQFDVVEDVVHNFVQPATRETDAWVTATGLNLKFDVDFPETAKMAFQTFPAILNKLRLEVNENQIVAENSYLKGGFIIPVISNENKFLFTVPINNLGFQDGYLENLVNTQFTFNAGSGDQEIKIVVKRAVLSGYEKIGMTIDLEWPSMGITLAGLRGFNVWGDYNIGFDNKNGTVPLTQRYNATLSGYPITIGVIGAGSNDGSYIFATTSDAVLGDDVSGGQGVPSINVYSISANPHVPKNAPGQVVVSTTKQIPMEEASANVSKNYLELQQNLAQKVEADQQAIVAAAENLQNGLANSTAQAYAPEDMLNTDGQEFPAEPGFGAEPEPGGKFNSRQQEIIYEIAAGFVAEMARPILDPVKKKTDSLNADITKSVNKLIDQAGTTVNTQVRALVNELANGLIDALRNDKVNVEGPIKAMADETIRRISQEIDASMRLSAQENILDPINVLLKDQINGRINKHITVNGTAIVYESITGERANAEEALKELIEGSPAVLKAIVKDVGAFVSLDNIRSTLDATASDFIKNIDMSDVGHDLRKAGEEILKAELNKEIGKAVTALAARYADDIGLGGFGVASENPIDFVGVAERFSKDGLKGVFNIDQVRVRLKTPVIDLDGFMNYTPKHPVYGDVWLGDIDMTIKVPKKFSFNAIYFNGRKDDISYWFCQLTPPGDNNTAYQLGKPLAKAAKPLKDPVNIGIAQIVGASGRLYHHMKETPNSGIVPDNSMRYGAYMHFVFFDKGTDGKNLRLEVSGEINSSENGDYTIAFDGNMQTRSKSPEVLKIDKNAAVQGTVMIRYNSAEEHFLGYARVVVQTSSLCAEASLLVDVKPGKWRLAIGTREERIVFVPGCAGWSPTGWLDINQNEAEIGLGVQYSAKAKSPSIDIGLVEFNIQVDAGFAFGILAVIQYNPSFALMRAGVWIDMWANVIANYKFFGKGWKSVVLIEIFIRGDLVIIFNPPPTTLEGNLKGHVKVLCFSVNFKAHMKKEI